MGKEFPEIDERIRDWIERQVVDVDCIRESCGYGVPLYDFRSERDSLANWRDAKTNDEMLEYRSENNARSLDGLPGLTIDPAGTPKASSQ
jgi:hypothetical protein